MGSRGGVLLTGATGLLGRYLLRDLLLAHGEVAVLARDARSATAQQRIDELVASWSETLGLSLARPTVLVGDLRTDGLGLGAAERRWLSRRCRAVLHAAAHVGFGATLDGEPWQTNFEGTRWLLELCAELGLDELHHVSTAFVCGQRTGPVREDELECGQEFHNDYERSKYETERLLRRTTRARVTVYRPSIIVGDSHTGHTSSYHGFYRFLAMGDLLAGPAADGRRQLCLRVPFTGAELHDLVPVDGVAESITRLLRQPHRHGRTFHLVARQPVPGWLIKDVAQEVLAIDGVCWVGPERLDDPSPLEKQFQELVRHYWPYHRGSPFFDQTNTTAALADFRTPLLDRALLARLIRFAVVDRWGRRRRSAGLNCAHYVEEFFPGAVRRSTLASIPLEVTVGLKVSGAEGGCWTGYWKGGELVSLERDGNRSTDVVFRLDTATFAAIVAGKLAPQEAFFARRIEIEGDMERGLKLATLFGHLVRECPFGSPSLREADHVSSARV